MFSPGTGIFLLCYAVFIFFQSGIYEAWKDCHNGTCTETTFEKNLLTEQEVEIADSTLLHLFPKPVLLGRNGEPFEKPQQIGYQYYFSSVYLEILSPPPQA